jgi:hypothetical protein
MAALPRGEIDRERQQGAEYDSFAKPSTNGRNLRFPAEDRSRRSVSNGSRGGLFWGVDALGCLRSLRFRPRA